MIEIPIEISARHAHLTELTLKKLFGPEVELKTHKKLSQADEFASAHVVTLRCGDRKIENVRVLGPCRDHDQIEVAFTDARALKAKVPLRLSGNSSGSAPVTLVGTVGSVDLAEGMIIAKRHLHIGLEEAEKLGLKDGQVVSLEVAGDRAGRLDQCLVRIKPGFRMSFHLDTDEGNALGLTGREKGKLIIT